MENNLRFLFTYDSKNLISKEYDAFWQYQKIEKDNILLFPLIGLNFPQKVKY